MALGLPKLTSDVILLDGQNAGAVSYHNSVRPAGVKPQELQRWGQVYRNPQFIYQMSLGLSRLMADNGVDIHAIENNPTAMKKILFSLHQLTQNYLDAYCASDYIMASAMNGKRATPNHFVGYKAMYELVPLPSFAACKPVAQLPIMINARHYPWVGDALAVSAAKVARIAGEENTLSKPEAVLGKAKRVEEPPAAAVDDKSAKSDKSRKADKEDKGEKGGKKKDKTDKSEKKGKKKDA